MIKVIVAAVVVVIIIIIIIIKNQVIVQRRESKIYAFARIQYTYIIMCNVKIMVKLSLCFTN
jgi:hypothetical protein